jgi:hypothetical protein
MARIAWERIVEDDCDGESDDYLAAIVMMMITTTIMMNPSRSISYSKYVPTFNTNEL